MEILQELGWDDELPEQQTRTSHLLNNPAELRLGFDHCPQCGEQLIQTPVYCPDCRCIRYCSEACRYADANYELPPDEPEPALGHSAIICRLLQTMNDTHHAARARAEYETYPATLASIIRQRGRAVQQQHLCVHVIGASHDEVQSSSYTDDYAQALADVVGESSSVAIHFCGPEAPDYAPSSNRRITLSFHNDFYHRLLHDLLPPPDLVVLFHPGWTVPDYTQWEISLAAIPPHTDFCFTSNTEAEMWAELQYLMDHEWVEAVPASVAQVVGYTSTSDENAYLAVNPHGSPRIRQNTNLANDVYVKNRWIFGGRWGPRRRVESTAKRIKSIV